MMEQKPLDTGRDTLDIECPVIFVPLCIYPMGQQPLVGQGPPHNRSLTITIRPTTLGRTYLRIIRPTRCTNISNLFLE